MSLTLYFIFKFCVNEWMIFGLSPYMPDAPRP